MSITIYFLLLLSNFLFAFRKRDSKKKNNISYLLLIYSFVSMFLLLAGYRNNSGLTNDLIFNELEYNTFSITSTTYEYGYVVLMMLGKFLLLDFYLWRSVLIFCSLLLLFYTIKKYSTNPHFVLFMYSMMYLFQSAHLFRNFLAFAIFQVGISIYFYSDDNYRKFKFMVAILLAASIHSSFILYLPIIFLDSKLLNSRNIKVLTLSGLFVTMLVVIFGRKMLSTLILNSFASRLQVYFNSSVGLGAFLFLILHVSIIVMTYITVRVVEKNIIYERIYRFNLLFFILSPMYFIDGTFIRIARNVLPINYFLQGDYLNDLRVPLENRKLYLILSLMLLLFWFYITYFYSSRPDVILIPFFKDNIYLSGCLN